MVLFVAMEKQYFRMEKMVLLFVVIKKQRFFRLSS